MSCSYYRIKYPFTSIKIRDLPETRSKEISLYIGTEMAGQIVVSEEDEPDVLRMFSEDRNPVLVTYAKPYGVIGLHKYSEVEPNQQLISEYCDLVTAKEVLDMVKNSQKS